MRFVRPILILSMIASEQVIASPALDGAVHSSPVPAAGKKLSTEELKKIIPGHKIRTIPYPGVKIVGSFRFFGRDGSYRYISHNDHIDGLYSIENAKIFVTVIDQRFNECIKIFKIKDGNYYEINDKNVISIISIYH